ncbi:MAG TPA: NYN domain-containing protein [Candidatus Sulfotelmatobacter sp.]|nr:NYN domain-containing protein [Candidatus Sulfotelmatobacter sp.]
MPRLVDGDNLLGAWPGRTRSDAEKRQLAREIGRLASREGRRIVVVFDGVAPPGVSLGPDVHFSGAGRSADHRILELLRAERDPRGWTVVTNDRSLADQSRWVGAASESVREFRARLSRETGAEKPEGAGDIDFWLETFGGGDD